jgi:hypothetical protein
MLLLSLRWLTTTNGGHTYAIDLSNRDNTTDLLIFALHHRYIKWPNSMPFSKMFVYRRQESIQHSGQLRFHIDNKH